MIKYDKLWAMPNVTTYYLKKNGISSSAATALHHNNSVSISTINRLCELLNCQPGDILEYIPEDSVPAD